MSGRPTSTRPCGGRCPAVVHADDRMVREIEVSLPPQIAALDLRTSKATTPAVVDADSAVSALDSGADRQLVGLDSFRCGPNPCRLRGSNVSTPLATPWPRNGRRSR